jgi:hypothetical protein
MARAADAPVLRPQLALTASWTANLPRETHRNAYFTGYFLNSGNLVVGQAQ